MTTTSAVRTDAELIADFVDKGARTAFDELVVRYSRLVYSVCFRVIGDRHAAEDACQTTFMVLMQKAASLQGQPTLASWLSVVAQRSAQKLMRTEMRREAHTQEAAVQGNAMNQYDEADDLWEQVRPNLDVALGGLRPAEREAIVLRYLQGFSSSDASTVLGCPVRTFNARLSSGLSSLRQSLSRQGVTVSAPALLVMLDTFPLEPLPTGLAVSIQNVCHGQSAATSQVAQAASELSKCSFRIAKSISASAAWPVLPILVVVSAATATALGLSLPRSAEVPPAQAPITAAPEPAAPAKKTTIELFTRPEHLANWKIKSPKWQVEGNCLVGQGQQGNAFLCNNNLPCDFVLSLTATADSSYHFGWWHGESAIHLSWERNEVSLKSFNEAKGECTVLTQAPLRAGKHVYRVIRVGARMVVYADGQQLLSCQQLVDEPPTELGLFVSKGAPVKFENITVRKAVANDLPPEK